MCTNEEVVCMSKRRKGKKKDFSTIRQQFNNEVYGIFMISLGLILLTALQNNGAGKVGQGLKYLLLGLFSNVSSALPYLLVFLGVLIFINKPFWKELRGILFFITIFICVLITRSLLDFNFVQQVSSENFDLSVKTIFSNSATGQGGGIIGVYITYYLIRFFGRIGTYIIIIATILISLIMYTKISLLKCFLGFKRIIGNFINFMKKGLIPDKTLAKEVGQNNDSFLNKDINEDNNVIGEKIKVLDYTSADNHAIGDEKLSPNKCADSGGGNTADPMSDLVIKDYSIPSKHKYNLPEIGLLDIIDSVSNKEDKRMIVSKAKILEETLNNFGVQAKVLQVTRGPVITRYELQPSVGVKVSKIVNLSDDIALNLAASAIRIEAPIPGKAAIGIEIPNDDISLVGLREIIDSKKYKTSVLNLPFSLGKDISGNPVIADITQMPHLLIAGATGSGKSVSINTLILSLLYKLTPEYVRLLLIDPKMVELNQYNGIPHLLIPVVTDAKKATSALNWAVQEMTQRYKMFGENGVKDIAGYNQKNYDNKIPFIVIIIDELADLMLVAPNEVEDSICRLAQMARAAGIHLIVATQRPSVDVITGIIKANIPSRIAFSVASQTDSRTILDMGGAEKLLGKGDMLFYPMGSIKPKRIQGAFVSEKEVEKVVDFIKKQIGKPNYEADVVEQINNSIVLEGDMDSDEFFEEALKIIIDNQQASISMLQRRLKIGYNRAARLIDEMEARGIVGPYEGSKPRQVLIKSEEYFEEKSC